MKRSEAHRNCTAWTVRPALALALAAAVAGAGCRSVAAGVNTRMVAVQDDIVEALGRDDLARARQLAVQLERQQPAADTFALLGEVLWRTGELVDAEGRFRRAESGGSPGGRLGLARADLARGRTEGALEALEPLRSESRYARQAYMLLAALAWMDCNCPAAAMDLAAASAARDRGGEWPGVEAMALQAAGADGSRLLAWAGAASELAIDVEGRVGVVIDGRPAKLELALDGGRTTVGGSLAATLVPDLPSPAVSAIVAEVALGDLRSRAVVRVDPSLASDGRIGLDLLASLVWELSVGERWLRLATAAGELPAPDLRATYWGTARLPREGLGAQLLLRPRVAGRVLTAVLDVVGPSRLTRFVVAELAAAESPPGVGDTVDLELRLGARRQVVSWQIEDLLPMGRDGLIAPRAVIGADVLSRLRVRWLPQRLQVTFEELPATTLARRGR